MYAFFATNQRKFTKNNPELARKKYKVSDILTESKFAKDNTDLRNAWGTKVTRRLEGVNDFVEQTLHHLRCKF